ncbi:hypothetical protein ACHAXR_002919 [Thalassiosira sp. AJA248-18]
MEGNSENNDGHQEESNGNNNAGGEVTALHDLIAGGIAGSASVIVGHPFDTIKVRLQTSIPSSTTATSKGGSIQFQGLFKGMTAPLSAAAVVNAIIFGAYGSCIRLWENTFEDNDPNKNSLGGGGVHGTMAGGEGAIFIERGNEHGSVHEQIKRKDSNRGGEIIPHSTLELDSEESPSTSQLKQPSSADQQQNIIEKPPGESSSIGSESSTSRQQNTVKVFMCGAAAGTMQAFVICPMEHIKCRLQVQSNTSSCTKHGYKGPVDATTSIIKNHGLFRGLYRGMCVTLWRETPAFGMYFATYDTIKEQVENLLEEKDDNHPIPSHAHAWAASALAGGISGAWTWAIIYPFDVIKTQIQTGPLERHLQKGMLTVASDIVREHGVKHMFRGLGVTLARAFPVNAIIFPVYEFILVQLGDGG